MEKYKSFAIKGGCVLVFIALAYLFLRLALGIILPFAIALLIVSMARPIINKLCAKRKISKPFASVFVVSIILILITFVLSASVSLIINEVRSIIGKLIVNLESENNFISSIFEWIENIKLKFPFLNSILPGVNESIYSIVLEMVSNGIRSLSNELTEFIAGFITSLPSFIIALVIMLLSLFYFSKDYDKLASLLEKTLPKKTISVLPKIKKDVIDIMLKYFKSYSLLLLLTFVELFVGFLIIKIEHPFTLALIVAIVDLLPVLGVGTVLVPWSVILIASGSSLTGIGLLVLFAICYIVRQLAEPKILSKQMNVHPLVTLFAMYAGLKLAGLGGLILAPFLAFVGKTIYLSIKKEKTVENQIKL